MGERIGREAPEHALEKDKEFYSIHHDSERLSRPDIVLNTYLQK